MQGDIKLSPTTLTFSSLLLNMVSTDVFERQKLFPNVDPNSLTLTNVDAQSSIDEVLGKDPYTFIDTAGAALDIELEIATFGPLTEDNPAPSSKKDRGLSPSAAKPPRAPRLKRRTK